MHTILAGTQEWKIYHRRCKHRWNDGIKIPLQEIGCEDVNWLNPLNSKLSPICHLLALLGAHHILHVSRIRVNFWNNIRTGLFAYFCQFKDYIVFSENTASEDGIVSHN